MKYLGDSAVAGPAARKDNVLASGSEYPPFRYPPFNLPDVCVTGMAAHG